MPADVRRTIHWRHKIIMPASFRKELEASRAGVTPWSQDETTDEAILGHWKYATKADANVAAQHARSYVIDQYMVRPKTATGPVSAEGQARNKRLEAIRVVLVRVVHKPFTERHLVGYRVDVVGFDGVRRRMMSMPGSAESPVRPRAVTLDRLTQLERGTLIRGKNAKAAVRGVRAHLEGQRVFRIAVYKKGPVPGRVAPEVAETHRAEACAKRKRFTSMKAAYAATANARRRGTPLVPHGCKVCGGFHVAYHRNVVTG